MIFENTFKIRLAKEGVKSTPSHYNFLQTLENDHGAITRKEQTNGRDAVLLTRVVDQRTQAVFNTRRRAIRYVPKPSLKSGQVFERFPDDRLRISSYSTGYTAIYKPSTPMMFVVMTVEFHLYDLRTEELIWSAHMETDLESNREEMMQKLADEAVKDLKLKSLT